MWTLLLIAGAIGLWYSPSLRRSLARLIDPDKQTGHGPGRVGSTEVKDEAPEDVVSPRVESESE